LRSPYRKHVGHDVVVQTEDATLLGGLAEVGSSHLVLSDASIGEQRGQTRMDGLVIVPLSRIAWVQVS